ncbi:uncharacterized protein TNCV_4862911 [Trichonephila clavipes]|nr:uncharacterized protein TNCV_4862911 [Trichonephila clavipes]
MHQPPVHDELSEAQASNPRHSSSRDEKEKSLQGETYRRHSRCNEAGTSFNTDPSSDERQMHLNVIILEAKHEEFGDDDYIYAKSLCEEIGISFELPRRIRRKHMFGDGSKDDQLSYEDDLRRTMFSSIDRVTAEIGEKFQHICRI